MDRNKLTEMLLRSEVLTRFVSIKEATEAGIKGEPAAIEAALHSPALLAIDGERNPAMLAEALRNALLVLGAKQGVGRLVTLFCEKNMSREALMEWAWGELHRVLPPYAAKHGCWLEIQDRRGAGIVGILLRAETKGTSWQMVEWLDDLDGEAAFDAWQMVVAHGGVDN